MCIYEAGMHDEGAQGSNFVWVLSSPRMIKIHDLNFCQQMLLFDFLFSVCIVTNLLNCTSPNFLSYLFLELSNKPNFFKADSTLRFASELWHYVHVSYIIIVIIITNILYYYYSGVLHNFTLTHEF